MTGRILTPFVSQSASGPALFDMKSENGGYIAGEGFITYTLTASEDGTLYMYISSSAHTPCRVYVGGVYYTDYQASQAGVAYTVYLGEHKKAIKSR